MKRIFIIRRRRYLCRAVLLGFAAAALVPSAALAGYDSAGAGVAVDPYVGSVSAEDAHGMSASTGFVLPSADRKAVEQAQGTVSVYRRADDFAPPRNLTAPTVSAGSTIDWSRIALFASLGLAGILGAITLSLAATRKGVRPAHS